MAIRKYRLCPGCDQPMLPPGAEKMPNQYDHASGCPIDKIERLQREVSALKTKYEPDCYCASEPRQPRCQARCNPTPARSAPACDSTSALDEDTGTADDKLPDEYVDAVRAAIDGPQDVSGMYGEGDAAEADTKLLDYLSELRTEVCFHLNSDGKWTFIPDVQRCDEPDGIFDGETLREAIAAAKTGVQT